LTNQAVFLHPVVTAEVKMQDSIDRILRLTQDMPNLQTRVKVLATRVHELIDSKRKLTSQIDQGKGDEVLAYIRAGEGLVLSKTIENAVEDFNTRLTEEFSRVDMEEKALMDQTFQRLLLADLAILAVGILVTWLIFRSIANGLTHRFSPTTIARQH
jgi:CHASE3 domain sensor protein